MYVNKANTNPENVPKYLRINMKMCGGALVWGESQDADYNSAFVELYNLHLGK